MYYEGKVNAAELHFKSSFQGYPTCLSLIEGRPSHEYTMHSFSFVQFCVFSRKLQIFYCFIIFIFIASLYFIWSMDQKSKTRSRDAKKWQRNKTEYLWDKTWFDKTLCVRSKFYPRLFDSSAISVTLGNSGCVIIPSHFSTSLLMNCVLARIHCSR